MGLAKLGMAILAGVFSTVCGVSSAHAFANGVAGSVGQSVAIGNCTLEAIQTSETVIIVRIVGIPSWTGVVVTDAGSAFNNPITQLQFDSQGCAFTVASSGVTDLGVGAFDATVACIFLRDAYSN